jgi:hypothetical protein
MTQPLRVQRQRTKGWRMPANTLSVTRPGQFGNPYYPGCGRGFGNISAEGVRRQWRLETRGDAVRHFREYIRLMRLHEPRRFFADFVAPLRGKNLACWCKLCLKHEEGKPLDIECADCLPCHVDVLGPIVNADSSTELPTGAPT